MCGRGNRSNWRKPISGLREADVKLYVYFKISFHDYSLSGDIQHRSGVTVTGNYCLYARKESHLVAHKYEKTLFSFGRNPSTNYLAFTEATPNFTVSLVCLN
jgi:hypothetical protein